jgi:predicted RND superfamily exporter protein
MNKLKDRVIDFVLTKPKMSLLLMAVMFLPLLSGIGKFKEDYGAEIWYSDTNPLIKTLERFERTYGNDENIGIAIYSESGIFTAEGLSLIQRITQDAWKVYGVIRVESLSNYNITKGVGDDIIVEPFFSEELEEKLEFNVSEVTKKEVEHSRVKALTDKVLPQYLISKSEKVGLIIGTLKPRLDEVQEMDNEQIVLSTKKVIAKYNKYIKEKNLPFELKIFGTAAVTDAYRTVSHGDIKLTMPLLFGVIVIFLLYSFRSIEGLVLPLVIINLSIAFTFGFMGIVDLTFNNLTAVIPGVLTAICIADTVHLLQTFYMKLGEGSSFRDSIKMTLQKNLGPTFLTTVSTSIGFATLSISDIIPVRDIGILAAFGTLVAWFLTIFFLPPILLVFPEKLFVPKKGYAGKKSIKFSMAGCRRYTDFIFKFKWPVVIIFTFSSIIATYISFQNEVNSDPLKYFSEDVQIRVDYDLVRGEMGGVSGPQIVIHSGKNDGVKNYEFLTKVDAYQKWIRDEVPTVAQTLSVIDIIKDMNKVFHGGNEEFYRIPKNDKMIAQFLFLYTLNLPQGMGIDNKVSTDNENMRLSVIWDTPDSKTAVTSIDLLNSKAKEFGLNAYVSGQMPLYQRLNGYVVKTFMESMSMAICLVGLLMILIFKSLRLGSLSMLPNIVPLTFGGALMTLTNNNIDLGSAINYSVCLGVVVDDTIHFLFDYNRSRKEGLSVKDSLVQVFYHTGPALVMTTLILSIGFGLFVVSSFVPNVNFGLFCALIFTTAVIVDLVFLPALLLLPIKKEQYN